MIAAKRNRTDKAAKKVAPPSARPAEAVSIGKALPGQAVYVQVSSPYIEGARDTVKRVINTIDYMLRHKQLDKRAYRAAELLQAAYESVYGQAGGALDLESARGPSMPGSPPLPHRILAAQRLNEAKMFLYPTDYRVVNLAVIEGRMLEQVAGIIANRSPTRAEKEEVGRTLRRGLNVLADRWFKEAKGGDGRINSWKAEGARPTEFETGVRDVGGVAHANGRKVVRG